MDKIDLNISNGSCWSNVNVALEEEYIPCGNVASGNSYACCHYGDNCLSSNACFHKKFGITYLAGCTSQDFSGPACQNKGEFFNQSWVGLVRCDPDQSYWAGCPEYEGIVGSSPPTQNCQCSKDNILFEDSPRLDNIASLPLGLGGTISWFPNHEPTTAVPTNIPSTTFTRTTYSTTASSVSSKAPDESSPPTPTPSTPSTAVPSPASKLSAGDKAGIGVGSVLGALAIGCIIAMFVVMRKRKSKINESPGPRRSSPTIEPGPVQPEPPGHSSPPKYQRAFFNPYLAYAHSITVSRPVPAVPSGYLRK
ncbi:hypothetical protein NUW58_g9194 [Xylaria curta]|uniref:Uncharacterized protein n=1 Tax=Xylaria curta TaxID=42375 RepID=A0ACC1N004_9PEZI|nr:hypothetical protein NUW58_g9194 [Xylaria curta]